MAETEDSYANQSREDRARRLVREKLQREPLTFDGAVKRERGAVQKLIESVHNYDDSSIDRIFAAVAAKPHPRYDAMFDEVHRALHAIKVERHLPPSPQREHLLALLRRPAPLSNNITRRGGISDRNFNIWLLVGIAVECGLHLSRNRAQRDTDGVHSACSLVADELKRSGLRLSEDAVEKIIQTPRLGGQNPLWVSWEMFQDELATRRKNNF
jgi:hypothetical protein